MRISIATSNSPKLVKDLTPRDRPVVPAFRLIVRMFEPWRRSMNKGRGKLPAISRQELIDQGVELIKVDGLIQVRGTAGCESQLTMRGKFAQRSGDNRNVT